MSDESISAEGIVPQPGQGLGYVDGFVIPVPTIGREAFYEHARTMDALFLEYGALRVVECWSDDVPPGKRTDFYRSVEAGDGEAVVFSWIEWPNKATRDRCFAAMESDPRFFPEDAPVPFDGARMIYGGFVPALVLSP